MSKLCVKLKKPSRGLQIVEFNSHPERNEWLRSNGFYEVSGIYRHLDGSTAGLFTKVLSQAHIALTCDKPIQSSSVWSKMCTR